MKNFLSLPLFLLGFCFPAASSVCAQAADKSGAVYVAWHGKGDKEGEEHRRVWVARSTDDGKSLSREAACQTLNFEVR